MLWFTHEATRRWLFAVAALPLFATSACFIERAGTRVEGDDAGDEPRDADIGVEDAEIDATRDAGPACEDSAFRCVGDVLEVCVGDPPDWSEAETCPLGCADAHCLRVVPRNGVPETLLEERSGELAELRLPDGSRIDTTAGEARAPDGSLLASCTNVDQGASGPALCIFAARRVVVEAGEVSVAGDRALVLVGREEVELAGVLHVGGAIIEPGPGAWAGASATETAGAGPGAGAAGASFGDHSGGGGGGYGGRGGDSGTGTEGGSEPLPAVGGAPYPCTPTGCSAELEPLLGGSGGGAGQCSAYGGGGGGAVHVLAGGRIVVRDGAGVDAGGGGGSTGTCSDAGGGGGSGGGILLEAPVVVLEARAFLVANGGGGGSRSGDGEPGQRNASAARGAGGGSRGDGGDGAADTTRDGDNGESRGHAGGGGGGAVGRIRFLALAPTLGNLRVDRDSVVSPNLTTEEASVAPLELR